MFYCDVSVNVTSGWPNPYGPSAVTCTVPAVAGRVSTTAATPDAFVVTVRAERVPAVVVKNAVAPDALPPDEPGLSATDRFRVVPWIPF